MLLFSSQEKRERWKVDCCLKFQFYTFLSAALSLFLFFILELIKNLWTALGIRSYVIDSFVLITAKTTEQKGIVANIIWGHTPVLCSSADTKSGYLFHCQLSKLQKSCSFITGTTVSWFFFFNSKRLFLRNTAFIVWWLCRLRLWLSVQSKLLAALLPKVNQWADEIYDFHKGDYCPFLKPFLTAKVIIP